MESTNNQSLYERLGGGEGIAAIVDDIVEANMQNPAIKARFTPLKDNPAHLEQIKKHTISFLSAGSGGPHTYTGKDMTSAHRGMNISPGEYMHTVDDILYALDKHQVDPDTRKEVLAIAFSLKEQIIGV